MQQQEQVFPTLRFPDFVDPWPNGKLEKYATVKTGSRDTQNKIDGGEYPFFVRSNTIERINTFALDAEAVLTSGDGVGVGKNIHYINGKFDYHQRVYAIYDYSSKLNGQFFYHFFKEKFLRRVMRLSAKNSVDSVRMSMITEMSIPIPQADEQQKIAEFLGAVDEKIAQIQKKKSLLENYKKGCMQKLFSQEIRFTDDNGNAFPDWEEAILGEHFSVKTGDSNREDSTEEGEYVFFDRSNDTRASSKYLFDCEAIIVAGEGKNFPPKYYKGKFDLHQRAYAITKFGDKVARFIYYWVYKHRQHFLKFSVGSTMPSLRMNAFEKFPLSFPHRDEQKKIADFLSSIDDKITLVAEELDKAKTFKKGLLQQMFV